MTEFEVLNDEELQNIQDNLCCMCIGEPPQGFDFGKQLLKNSISCQLAKDKSTHQQIVREIFACFDDNIMLENDLPQLESGDCVKIDLDTYSAIKAKYGGQA